MVRRDMTARLLALIAAMLVAACSDTSADRTGMLVTQAEAHVPAATGDARHPVVLELFQSQGCSSCPPANANVNALAARPDILALSFAVTYWDQLGWKDKFASAAYTARERDYAHAAHEDTVSTPHIVINGRAAVVGTNRPALDAAIARQGPLPGSPVIDQMATDGAGPSRILIGAAPFTPGPDARAATVWGVDYDPREQAVAISAGENSGRTLPHRNIVRRLAIIGTWSGRSARYALPRPQDSAYRQAVLIQLGSGGPLLTARKL